MPRPNRRKVPLREAASPQDGALNFVEMSSEDPSATKRFLTEVFGWRFQSRAFPQGIYLSGEAPGGGRGGIRPARPSEAPGTLTYLRVKDLSGALERVTRAGGKVVLAPVEIPGMGSFFWFQVPGGPILACWQDAPPGPGKK
jgi:uncharacterized protein